MKPECYLPILAIGLLAIVGSPASAKQPLVLEPASDWEYTEFDDRCRASRVFGEGRDETTMWIEQGGSQANYNLTLLGRPLRNPYGGGVHLRFGEEKESIRSYIAAKSSTGRPVLVMYGVSIGQAPVERGLDDEAPEAEFRLARAADINTVNLRSSIVQPLTLNTGEMLEPLGFLGMCGAKIEGLLSEAGRALTGEARPPQPLDEGDWLNKKDYPSWLVRAGMSGQLMVRLTVNQRGKPSSCFVLSSNKPQLFDDAVCLGLMKRAKFKPAHDASGKPVASYHFRTVQFEIN